MFILKRDKQQKQFLTDVFPIITELLRKDPFDWYLPMADGATPA